MKDIFVGDFCQANEPRYWYLAWNIAILSISPGPYCDWALIGKSMFEVNEGKSDFGNHVLIYIFGRLYNYIDRRYRLTLIWHHDENVLHKKAMPSSGKEYLSGVSVSSAAANPVICQGDIQTAIAGLRDFVRSYHKISYVSSWLPLFPSRDSVLIYIYLYVCILYTSSVIGRIFTYTRSVVQYWWSCTRSQSIGLFLGVRVSCVECHLFVFFGLPIVFCSIINSLILGCLWPLVFVLNNNLTLGIWLSVIFHAWTFSCPWTFFQNIGFNMAPSGPLMSHLATQLGYSAGEFQALQLIVLAAFGVVDQPFASCMFIHFLEIDF